MSTRQIKKIKQVDEEWSQSRARFLICIISLVVFSGISLARGLTETITMTQGLATILFYFAFSSAWFWMVHRFRGQAPWRRYITMTTDLVIVTIFMHLGGKYVSTFYPLFLWVVIGNGIRFGARFLVRGVIVGSICFTTLLLFDSFWRANLEIGLGLLIGVVVLPVFFLGVLRRLRRMSLLQSELEKSQLAEKAKDQFLATMSHEIRTPMNGVLGMAEALQDTRLDAEQRDHLQIITRSVESLLNVINDILDYSKITSSSLTLEAVPFDLKQVLEDVCLLLQSTAEGKGIALLFDYPEEMQRGFRGDPTRIRQIALNLLGNAIKFTEEGQVQLSCETNAGSVSGQISLTISDTGIGIPEHRLAAVFDQFEQADNSTTRQFGGTGLGLAISRQLAMRMGGDIEVDSVTGLGSTFTVKMILPICERPVKKTTRSPAALPHYGFRALIAEDNKINQVVVKKMLNRIGITVDIADNGAIALEMLDAADYDLIFMDICMPVMSGFEATEAIRARGDHLAQIPILALTAEAAHSKAQHCLDVGMDIHLSKPLRIAEVIEAIESLESLQVPVG